MRYVSVLRGSGHVFLWKSISPFRLTSLSFLPYFTSFPLYINSLVPYAEKRKGI
nr:MAG TPA: hypothetical protein [Caudoviricetes sp.]